MKLKRALVIILLVLAIIAVGTEKALALECGVLPQGLCDAVLNPVGTGGNISATSAIQPLVDFIVNLMVGIIGTVFVLVIIISGVQISASAGNEDVVKKGKENIFKAVTGMVLLISFRAIFELTTRVFSGVDPNIIFANDSANSPFAAGGIPRLLQNAIGIASMVAGVVSVVFIIVGAIQYIGSGGGDGLVKAKKTITYAVAGLVISILAYTIVSFIGTQLQ